MELVTYGFGNVGRDDGPGSSYRLDRLALEALEAAMPRRRAVLLLCEIREGDDNDELALARRIFAGWRFYCTATREPFALSPDWAQARSRVLWVRDSSVQRWSPRRSVNVLHLPGTSTSVIGGHMAAGAYHGDRPPAARAQLRTSWDNHLDVHRRVERRLHGIGRDVVWLEDVNRVRMPEVVRGEVNLFHDRTDWGRALAAEGRRPRFHRPVEVPFRVDSHDGHVVRGGFADAA